jgi:hypothetical protein
MRFAAPLAAAETHLKGMREKFDATAIPGVPAAVSDMATGEVLDRVEHLLKEARTMVEGFLKSKQPRRP